MRSYCTALFAYHKAFPSLSTRGSTVTTRRCNTTSTCGATKNLDFRGKDVASVEGPIPNLAFLATPTTLLDSVDSTLEISRKLLNRIPSATSPQEKHDLIDTTSNVLCLLLDPCEFVRQIHPDENYKKAASEAFQKGYEFMSEANSRRDLYEVICQLDSPEGHVNLNDESIKNVIQLRRDMESNGIHLPDKERNLVTAMNIKKEELAMQFLTELQGSAQAYSTLQELLRARYELAQLLGFESYAQQQLRGTMLENQEKVWQFLCRVSYKYRLDAEKEFRAVQQYAGNSSRKRGSITDDERARITALLRRNAEPEGANQYFSVANCIRGIGCLCREVFGVRLELVPFEKSENFNNLARKYHVYDENNCFLGVIILDMYMNPMKYCQAGHLTLQLGCRPHQEVLRNMGLSMPARQYPIVALTCNVAAVSGSGDHVDDEHTLMDPHEVTTLFHEFGHAMHTIFGQTRVQNLAGTRSSIDYVETFSQLFEQFLTSHDFLRLWACHVHTKEPISKDMVERRNNAANMFVHLDRLDQVVLSAVDQVLHGPQPLRVYYPSSASGASFAVECKSLGAKGNFCNFNQFQLQEALVDIVKPFTVATPTQTSVLGTLSSEHIAGYPGGYYGYLYSLTIARRIWAKKFAANPLSRTAGSELVQKVMSFGAACDPKKTMEAYLEDRLEDIDTWA